MAKVKTESEMSVEELEQWYDDFVDMLAAQGIDINNKSDLFRVRALSSDGSKTFFAFTREDYVDDNEQNELVAGAQAIANTEYEQDYVGYTYRLDEMRRQEEREQGEAMTKEEWDKCFVKWAAEKQQMKETYNQKLEAGVRDRYAKALSLQEAPPTKIPVMELDYTGGVNKIQKIRSLYKRAYEGKLFLTPKNARKGNESQQIYLDGNGKPAITGKLIDMMGSPSFIKHREMRRTRSAEEVLGAGAKWVEAPKDQEEPPVVPEPTGGMKFLRFITFGLAYRSRFAARKQYVEVDRPRYDSYLRDKAEFERQCDAVNVVWHKEQNNYPGKTPEEIAKLLNTGNAILSGVNPADIRYKGYTAMELLRLGNPVTTMLGQELTAQEDAQAKAYQRAANTLNACSNAQLEVETEIMTHPERYGTDGKLLPEIVEKRERMKKGEIDLNERAEKELASVNKKMGKGYYALGDEANGYAEYIYMRQAKLKLESGQPLTDSDKAFYAPKNYKEGVEAIKKDPMFKAVLAANKGNKDLVPEDLYQDYTAPGKAQWREQMLHQWKAVTAALEQKKAAAQANNNPKAVSGPEVKKPTIPQVKAPGTV